ncbi:FAD-binding oxidoreductase [Streptomyces sp. DH12]|uniref:FAD-binding oxidoreductase n=1 Tax=Streptomyces sp. DH12 TaxID=2857010 RepID=UPI001E3EFD77|nr:FAD-binding oxidoreductase [Streptomyces sp. DH12]
MGQNSTAGEDRAVARWRDLLGPEAVAYDEDALAAATRNTSAFAPRRVVAVLRPSDPDQVERVVRIAREEKVPLHAYSTGRNWGLGSRLPVRDGCALLDLSAMNRIRAVDTAGRYAVVEPGVTQLQLADHLAEHAPELVANVTGSSPDSSVLGNLLERGTGFRRHRAEEVRGLEVVLGTGDRVRTGLWAGEGSRQLHHYPYGIGPSLDGLFVQSNLGVVTAAVVDLLPRQEELRLLMFTCSETALPGVVDAVRGLFLRGTVRSIVHVFNDKRILAMTRSDRVPTWTGAVAVDGTAAQVALAVEDITATLAAEGAAVRVVGARDAAGPDADPMVAAMYDVHSGRPTTAFLQGLYQSVPGAAVPTDLDVLDDTTVGYLACMPVAAVDGRTVADLVALVEKTCADHGLVPAIAVNPTGPDYLESVVNLYFDRTDPAQEEAARACNTELHQRLYADGFRFYRVGVETMETLTGWDTAPWDTVALLKDALDPDGILSPGRYAPLRP